MPCSRLLRLALIGPFLGLLLAALPLRAEPPPGHPSAGQAGEMLGLPGAEAPRPYSGSVLQAINSNQFTYIEVGVEGKSGSRWLAAPRLDLKPGTRIRFGEGRLLAPFYSRKLERSFDAVTFVGPVEIIAPAP